MKIEGRKIKHRKIFLCCFLISDAKRNANLILTFDVQDNVLTPPLADPVGGLAHVVARLPLPDPLQDQAEVGEDDPLLRGV